MIFTDEPDGIRRSLGLTGAVQERNQVLETSRHKKFRWPIGSREGLHYHTCHTKSRSSIVVKVLTNGRLVLHQGLIVETVVLARIDPQQASLSGKRAWSHLGTGLLQTTD
jgi:hypothetical protein